MESQRIAKKVSQKYNFELYAETVASSRARKASLSEKVQNATKTKKSDGCL
jgi:hypothetical protein